MTNKIAVQCIACRGKGEKENQFTQNMDLCRPCNGSGQVTPCDGFFSRKPAVMRNRNCEYCFATEAQHKEVVIIKALQNA